MFSAVGLFLGLKSKMLHEQNVIYFLFLNTPTKFQVSRVNNKNKIAKTVDRHGELCTVYFLKLKAENTAVT